MPNESMPQTGKMPPTQPAEMHEKPVWNAAAPDWEARDLRAQKIAELEARAHEIEAIAASRLKRIKAVITRHPKDGELEKLYTQLRKLREEDRFKEDGGTVH